MCRAYVEDVVVAVDQRQTHTNSSEPNTTNTDHTNSGACQSATPTGILNPMPSMKLDRSVVEETITAGEEHSRDEDPCRRQAGYEEAASGYNSLAAQTDDPTYAQACRLAALFYEREAVINRWDNRIPALQPRAEVKLIGFRTCRSCGRPWQIDTDGACEHCPQPLFGVPAGSIDEAARFPRPEPADVTTPEPTYG